MPASPDLDGWGIPFQWFLPEGQLAYALTQPSTWSRIAGSGENLKRSAWDSPNVWMSTSPRSLTDGGAC
jgi:hypothetical protein